MSRAYNYNVREFRRILIDNGYEFKRQTGSHQIWVRPDEHGNDMDVINIPATSINAMLARRVIKEHKLYVYK